MRQAATKPTDPWAKLDALMKTEPEPMGPEWFTCEEFASRYGLSMSGAVSKLNRMRGAKQVEHWKGVGRATRRVTNKYKATP